MVFIIFISLSFYEHSRRSVLLFVFGLLLDVILRFMNYWFRCFVSEVSLIIYVSTGFFFCRDLIFE